MTTLFDLTGKTAVITGSTRGIGLAIAHRMAEHGARVVVSSRKTEACDAAAAAINAAYGDDRALAVPANISRKEDLAALIEAAHARLGRIDILVCNAASNPYYGPGLEIADEQFRKILENNILSNHWLIQMAAPHMIERKDGAIIVISSIGGLKASTTIGAYNISKAADLQLVRNMAAELGPHNIRVNAICPGLIKTDFARALWDRPDMDPRWLSPLGRIGEPDEIAGAAVFLASKAGSFTNGHALVVDGGTTIAGGE